MSDFERINLGHYSSGAWVVFENGSRWMSHIA